MKLITEPNIADPDGLYQQLIDLHQGRSDEDSARVNARLILLLVNHIGDPDVIGEAVRCAGPGVSQKKIDTILTERIGHEE